MTRRDFLSASLAAGTASAATKKLNFVFVLLDDLGWRDFGCYGNTFHETPHLDRLCAEGVKFTNAYAACPVCSPTRASILTGRYPVRFGMTDWIPGRTESKRSVLQPATRQELPLEETTLAELLKPLGYRTASIGKWHLGGDGFEPRRQGFDVNVAGTFRGHPESYFGPFKLPQLEGGSAGDYLTDRLTDAAEQFIEESAGRGPFFLYLPEFAVHLPLQGRQALVEKYRAKNGGKEFPNPVYAAMLDSVDQAIGRLRAKLRQKGVDGETVFIVTSDNGGVTEPRITDNSPLRAGKGHLYEGGIREPLLVLWPGVTRPGTIINHHVTSIDYLPTLVEIAGGTVPNRIDGVSFTNILRRGIAAKDRPLFWHYPHYSPQGGEPSGAVRLGDWKLIEFFDGSRCELYNLKDDIGEQRNLIKRHPEKAEQLQRRLTQWRNEVGATLPLPNPDRKGREDNWKGREPATPPA
jgi:arylsulfatase A-like enzyme